MDQHKQIKSIEEVQKAETSATKAIADAGKDRDTMIADAHEKARKIVSSAMTDSKAKMEDSIKRLTAELETRKKHAIEKATKGLEINKIKKAEPA